MTVIVKFLHPRATADHVGMIPYWLDERNPKPARDQINDNYGHGGGWHSMTGFTMQPNDAVLHYPGDPPFRPIAVMQMRDETIYAYEHSIFAIVQPDGTFDAARLD
jgi:hypothetical protein